MSSGLNLGSGRKGFSEEFPEWPQMAGRSGVRDFGPPYILGAGGQ